MFQSSNGIIAAAIILANGLRSLANLAPRQASILASLRPAIDIGKCMSIRGNIIDNGIPVEVFPCNQTATQNWQFTRGSTTNITLAGTNFCVDAGANPSNGGAPKLFECFDNLPSQTWNYTNDDHIQLGKTGLCLAFSVGSLPDPQLQLLQCDSDSTNQFWVDVRV